MKKSKRRILLVVMDGIGLRNDSYGNAVELAYTPTLDSLKKKCFFTQLKAHGPYVGLPSEEDMGNSEVGHNAMGAGRIFSQGAKLVSKSIDSGDLFETEKWLSLTRNLKKKQKTLHLLGLLSDGNVHSHEKHLHTLIQKAWKAGVKKIRIHALLDGRDVPPQSAQIYLERLEKTISELKTLGCDVQIASAGGRMKITMDRYNADWNMVKRGWDTHVGGKGPCFESAQKGLDHFRKEFPGIIDQDLPPFVIQDTVTKKAEPMKEGDSVLLFNFRGDRSLEISKAFEEEEFSEFERKPNPKLNFYGITEYDGDLKIPKDYLVSPPTIKDTLGEHLCQLGLRQYACSETQKFGHVTYFWNGNRSGFFDPSLEHYEEIPSDTTPFNQKPWMKAFEITEATIAQMEKKSFDFARINFANGDMVGHTGNLEASVIAVATIDLCLKRILECAKKTNASIIITADHGNCEEMLTKKNGLSEIKTSHTLSSVPFYFFDPTRNTKNFKALAKDPSLANIANTVLHLMGLETRSLYLDSILEEN